LSGGQRAGQHNGPPFCVGHVRRSLRLVVLLGMLTLILRSLNSPRLAQRSITLTAVLLGLMTASSATHDVRAARATAPALSQKQFSAPAWLFPTPAPTPPLLWDSITLRRLPRSRAAYTDQRLHDGFNTADWDSASHAPMPSIVRYGRKPEFLACGYCHMPDGRGRPENASIAGMSAPYIIRQLADMKDRTRQSPWHAPYAPNDNMQHVADRATDAEVAIAASYFAGVRGKQRTRVVETSVIPRIIPALGLFRRDTARGTEPLGQRLIEVATDFERHELRDPSVGYTAYAPPGSIARGRALARRSVATGLLTCEGCHGATLNGMGDIPPLAGRGPTYLLRQLIAFRTGDRSTTAGAPMRVVAAAMTLDDMIAVAAYAASLRIDTRPSAGARHH
jgi:cytochrome c553